MMDNLYNYVFWYNPYQELWYAIPTTQYIDFFSGERKPTDALKSKTIETLIHIVQYPESISNLD
jgi:hypothetical protein